MKWPDATSTVTSSMKMLMLAVFVSSIASGQIPSVSAKRALKEAGRVLEDAQEAAEEHAGSCAAVLSQPLEKAAEEAAAFRKSFDVEALFRLRLNLSALSTTAGINGCPLAVSEGVSKAQELLETARLGVAGAAAPPAQGPVILSSPRMTVQSILNGRPAVRVSIDELSLHGFQGRTFYLGVRYRSVEGDWTDWVTTQVWSVPTAAFVWKNAFNHFIPASALAEDDFANGRFVVQVGVFDGANRNRLAFRETFFRVRNLPRLPVGSFPRPF
jgi:hypothetical protein